MPACPNANAHLSAKMAANGFVGAGMWVRVCGRGWVSEGGCAGKDWGRCADLFEPFNTSLELFVPFYSKMGDNNNNNNNNKQQQNKEYEVAEKPVSAT